MATAVPPVPVPPLKSPSPEPHLRLQILGPLRLWRDDVELDPGPRQQAHLLALLLARARKPISTNDLIDLIWDQDVPSTAVNILQKYIGTLRRILQPTLPARAPSRYLQRRGNGYLFTPDPGMLDVATFRDLVTAARTASRPDIALQHYLQALALWHGPAGDGLNHGTSTTSIFATLDTEFFTASMAAAELAVSLDQPDRLLPPLRMAAAMAPLHESVQAHLITTLAAAGQQAQALTVFTAVRTHLADELGINPGPALRTAHQQVLSQAQASRARPLRLDDDLMGTAERPPPISWTPPVDSLVGRVDELAVLRQTVRSALAGGSERILIEGEPGVGKTRLLEEITTEAHHHGALVVWGRCLEGDGTPSMWPWIQAIRAVLVALPPGKQDEWHTGDLGRLMEPRDIAPTTPVLPDSGAQFRLFEQAVAAITQVSTHRPLILVIDDLQWADTASLHMFTHLAARLPTNTAIIGALRNRAPVPGSELSRLLATASRLPHHRRIHLGPLDPADVTELVRRETGSTPDPRTTDSIYARTAGNPFFVQELARLLTQEPTAHTGVPSTVRDVVRDRMTGLSDPTRNLLQIAALIGRDVNLTLLAHTADLDIQTCLDHLEPVEALGLLTPTPIDPYSLRFVHDLVRESITETTPPRRLSQLHLRVADALEALDSDSGLLAERLAHHLWAAGPLADPARTTRALMSAGHRAAAKSALEAASQQLQSAARLARSAGLAELELSALSQLTAVVGMQSGYVGSTLDLLERAENLARSLGREREASDFLFSRWAAYSQGIQLERAGPLARRLLDQGETSSDPIVRAYGLHAWGIHQWDIGNVGEAFRYLSQNTSTVLEDLVQGDEDPLRRDLRLLWPVMLALMTALNGDVDSARKLLDTLEAAADEDPYVITVWAAFSATVAALAGDPAWALRVAERGISADPEPSFAFLGSYPRLARCWALAVTGVDPTGAAAEAETIITTTLLDPPRSGLITWYVLLGEMRLAAGSVTGARAALEQAGTHMETYGQRYPEGLLLLLRARLLQAHGEPVAAVRAAAEQAWTISTAREAHLFARRTQEFLAAPARPPLDD